MKRLNKKFIRQEIVLSYIINSGIKIRRGNWLLPFLKKNSKNPEKNKHGRSAASNHLQHTERKTEKLDFCFIILINLSPFLICGQTDKIKFVKLYSEFYFTGYLFNLKQLACNAPQVLQTD